MRRHAVRIAERSLNEKRYFRDQAWLPKKNIEEISKSHQILRTRFRYEIIKFAERTCEISRGQSLAVPDTV